MIRFWRSDSRAITPATAGASVLLGLACLLTGAALLRAIRLEPLPTLERESREGLVLPAARVAPSPAGIEAAVAADLFQPERRAPAERYRLPFEERVDPTTPAPAAEIRLLGTVASPDGQGGFAMCQIGNDPPRIVRVGETLGGWTLRAVGQGRATVVSPKGEATEIAVPKPGS